jgi:GTP-binding protein HflX
LKGEELTQDDLTDLALLRFDLMAAIDVDSTNGLPGLVRAAHLLPASREDQNGNGPAYRFLDPQLAGQISIDFLDLMDSEQARWLVIGERAGRQILASGQSWWV